MSIVTDFAKILSHLPMTESLNFGQDDVHKFD